MLFTRNSLLKKMLLLFIILATSSFILIYVYLNIFFIREIQNLKVAILSIHKFTFVILLVVITLLVLIYFLIQKFLIKRLVRLNNAINSIDFNKGDPKLFYDDNNNDEISNLANSVQNLLTDMKNTKEKLIDSQEKYKSLFENSVDGISIRTSKGRFIDVNMALVKLLGYESKSELMQVDIPTEIYVDRTDFEKANSNEVKTFTAKLRKKDNSIIWAEISINKVKDEKLGYYYENIVRDVTERVNREKEIIYLNFYDRLTGLYNRTYIEEELQRIDDSRSIPISIILIDVNGLRMINEAFGTKSGNEVLEKVAKRIKSSCRKGEILARWGGDEFIVIVTLAPHECAYKIGERLIKNCSKIKFKNIPINVSVGIATKEKANENIKDTIIEAETRLYRHKLFEKSSVNSSIILSLERTLREKSSETEEHAERLKKFAVAIGKRIGLRPSQLDDLVLLASLHDIGKIGISDSILSKKSKLNENDWVAIKKHPEVGYQIAKVSSQLAHIADYILYHHEWWDGSGYPKGLSGENIPLLSRIISVVDAFDVMISGRVYKRPLSIEEAVKELRRCSGIQFDPNIVEVFINIIMDIEENILA